MAATSSFRGAASVPWFEPPAFNRHRGEPPPPSAVVPRTPPKQYSLDCVFTYQYHQPPSPSYNPVQSIIPNRSIIAKRSISQGRKQPVGKMGDRCDETFCPPYILKNASKKQSPPPSRQSAIERGFEIEKEMRLLSEMGWREDGVDYVITQDDIVAFRKLLKESKIQLRSEKAWKACMLVNGRLPTTNAT